MGIVYIMDDKINVDILYKNIAQSTLIGYWKGMEVINMAGLDWDNAPVRWEGITPIIINDGIDTLWSGVVLLNEATKNPIIPRKKINDCPNGWLLIWSDYNLGNGVSNKEFVTSIVSKHLINLHDGAMHSFDMLSSMSNTSVVMTGKKVQIFNDRILGVPENNSSENFSNDVALRYIMEW